VLSLSTFVRRLTRTTKARIVFIGIALLLAALSGYPLGASVSGALDKVLFDTAARFFSHPSSREVAVVLIDGKTLREYGTDGLSTRTAQLLGQLDQAASIVLDYPLAVDAHTSELAQAIDDSGRVVLPLSSSHAVSEHIEALPSALREQAAGRGQRQFTLGHYGAVNGFVPYLDAEQGGYPHIVLEAIRVAGAQHVHEPMQTHLRRYALSLAHIYQHAVLVMLGDPARVPQYSFADVIDDRVPAEAFANKLVFVGDAVGLDAGFQVSSLNMDAVSRPQLAALVADAVISGNMASELPRYLAVPIYLAIVLGMVGICVYGRGGWMHAGAIAWGAGMLVLPVLLLATVHRWLGLGLLPVACLLIYAHFAWERVRRTQNLLKREIDKLRAIRSTVAVTEEGVVIPVPSDRPRDPLHQIRDAMREIRSWQSTFVDMVNRLPYPVFVVTEGKLSVWNAKASDMLASGGDNAITLAQVQRLVEEHCRGEENVSVEATLGGREHMLLCVPYASADTSLGRAQARASYLVCLVDIADIKQGVTHDKLALRHIAHDLRSPLSIMLSMIEARADDASRNSGHEQAFLYELRRQADYSLRVAKDFLQLSRAEQLGRDSFAPLALLDVATEATDQLWRTAQAKSIALIGPECELDDTLMLGHSDMLIRALVNVIDNALKYSPPDTAITVRIADAGEGCLALHVMDQGIGIAEEHLAHLFEPFFQVAGKSNVEMGVGLGLPFVKTVIERHGGSISVSSQPGHGTDVRMVFPRALA
jgi:signal transduction histidine kinase/CHASE2 domain-containing sensor protein